MLPSYATGFARGMLSDLPWAWEGLVGAWQMSLGASGIAGSGLLRDWSGYHNHGMLKGAAKFITGVAGNVIEFDGNAGTYIDLGSPTSLATASASCIARVKIHATGSYMGIICLNSAPQFCVSGDTKARWYAQNQANTALSADIWYTLAVTSDGENTTNGLKYYLDGIPDGVQNSIAGSTTPRQTDIGRWAGADSWLMDGEIDYILYYNRVLKARQIKELYEKQKQLVT